jgi:SAM-dependent methyltransferase
MSLLDGLAATPNVDEADRKMDVRSLTFETLSDCLLCGSAQTAPFLQKSVQGLSLRFVACGRCGLIFQSPRLTPDSLAAYFSSSTFVHDQAALDDLLGYPDYLAWDKSYARTAARRLDRIMRFVRPGGRLLEIGSATGSFLLAAKARGFEVSGLDLSASFADIARSRGLDIAVNAIEDAELAPSQYAVVANFGGIACWRDPVRALHNIHRALAPDGLFVLNHFDCTNVLARAWGKRHFEFNHASLVIFSRQTMQRLLSETGFDILWSETERQIATLERIVGYLKLKTPLHILKALGVADISFPVTAFGTLFVICRKRLSARSRS